MDAPKFVPILAPPDHFSLPSTGDSTEKGDSWLTAVGKINAYFEHLFSKTVAEAPAALNEAETVSRKEFEAIKAELAETKAAFEKLVNMVTPMPTPAPQPEAVKAEQAPVPEPVSGA